MKVKINYHSASYCRVTLNNPPLNLFDPELSDELVELLGELEQNPEIKIVVFESAVPDYFMAHLDLMRAGELSIEPGPTGLSPWPDMAQRLQRAPFISVAVVRGRARGVGSEFIQAMDIRFASREYAVFGQIEVGSGLIPGGGGLERLPLLVGRSRALEIILGCDDFDADTAELYGWINRSVPDADLDQFTDRFATRVSGFNRMSIATAKEIINKRVPTVHDNDLAESQQRFFEMLTQPQTHMRIRQLLDMGLQQPGETERELGEALGKIPFEA